MLYLKLTNSFNRINNNMNAKLPKNYVEPDFETMVYWNLDYYLSHPEAVKELVAVAARGKESIESMKKMISDLESEIALGDNRPMP